MTSLCVSLVFAALTAGVSSSAYAQTWTSEMRLNKERSATGCADDIPPQTFTISGNKLIQKTRLGTNEMTIAADGSIDHASRSANGNALRLTGNVNTRTFELVNASSGCWWKLTPKQ